MKYLIKESQEKKLLSFIKNLVTSHLAKSTWVCDSEVNSLHDSEHKFEVLIILNQDVLTPINPEVREAVREMIILQVKKYLSKWLPHLENRIKIETKAKFC